MANATQPASNKGPVTASPNAFGAPPNNANRQPLNHNNYIQTQDATVGTNLVSPLALTTAIVPLVIPMNAVTVTLLADGIIRVSEIAGQTQYVTVPANTQLTLDVARQGILYVAAATTANLSFFFATL